MAISGWNFKENYLNTELLISSTHCSPIIMCFFLICFMYMLINIYDISMVFINHKGRKRKIYVDFNVLDTVSKVLCIVEEMKHNAKFLTIFNIIINLNIKLINLGLYANHYAQYKNENSIR